MQKIGRIVTRKPPKTPRLGPVRVPQAVTPKMLIRSLKTLQESKLIGVYFSSLEVAEMMMEMYPEVEQEFPLLHQEVKDKLICAANADIIGFKFDSGYHLLTDSGRCSRLDTRSKLMFWMLYKKMIDQRRKPEKSLSKLFRTVHSL